MNDTSVLTYGVRVDYYKIILEESTVIRGDTVDLHNRERDERRK